MNPATDASRPERQPAAMRLKGRAAPLARWRLAGRLGLLILVAGGIAAAWRWRGMFDPRALTAAISQYPAAPAIFLVIQVGASLTFVPRTLLAIVAGLAFGMWWGIVWAALGSVLGAAAGFLVARYVNAGLIDPAGYARLAGWLARVERGGWRAVMMIRLVPVIPHSLTNYALGLTRLRLGTYALGSLLGQLPATVAYADLGAAGGRALVGADWIVPTAIGLAALALSLVIPLIGRRWLMRTRSALEV